MDVQEYTNRKLGEQLVASETHLTDYLQEQDKEKSDFCIECLAKHSLLISQFAQEGSQFNDNDPYYSKVYKEGLDLYSDLPNFSIEKARDHYNKLRNIRKDLTAKHLIMGIKQEHTHL